MRSPLVLAAFALACIASPGLAQRESLALPGLAGRQARAYVPVPANSTEKTETEVIPLKFIACEAVVDRLSGHNPAKLSAAAVRKLPTGIDKIVSDPRTNSLLVVGDPDAIAQLKKTIAVIDAETTGIRIDMKVLQFDFDAGGSWNIQTMGTPSIVTLDNSPATISVQGGDGGYTVVITPHKNPDGTISVKGELRAAGNHASFHRDSPARAGCIVAGVSNSHSSAVRKAAASGRIPSVRGEAYTVYYLQIVSVK